MLVEAEALSKAQCCEGKVSQRSFPEGVRTEAFVCTALCTEAELPTFTNVESCADVNILRGT